MAKTWLFQHVLIPKVRSPVRKRRASCSTWRFATYPRMAHPFSVGKRR